MKLTSKILVGMVFGLIVGLVLNLFFPSVFTILNSWLFEPVGNLFIRAIKMIVVPLVFFSIAMGAAGIANPKKLGRIGIKTIVIYLLSAAIAIATGLLLANVIEPGKHIEVQQGQEGKPDVGEAPPIKDMLLNIIPENPVKALAEGDMLAIIFFALVFGISMAFLGIKVIRVKEFVEQANDVMMKLVEMLMFVVPYAAFALMAKAIGEAGLEMIGSMALYMITIILALIIHGLITYGIFLKILAKLNPLNFYKAMAPALEVAFTTSSSAAALPVTMECCEKRLNVPQSVNSFVLPLGATVNMDGTAIMQGVASVFIAQLYGIDLTFVDQLMIILTATLASIGTAAVPSAGIVMLTIVLNQVGLPLEGIGVILGVDRLLDMSRTVVNVAGDGMAACCIAKTEGADVKLTDKAS